MKNYFIYILTRLVILGAILILSNIIYSHYFFEDDLQKHSPIINQIREVKNKASILYLGESSNLTTHPYDSDRRTISEMTASFYPGIQFMDITKEATHAGIYKVLLQQLKADTTLETVIVTLNMRSFNADWRFSELETALQKSLVLLYNYPPLFNRFLLSFKSYDIKNEHERSQQVYDDWLKNNLVFPFSFPYQNVITWDSAMFADGIKNTDGSINYEKTTMACHYIKTYAFQIDTITNQRIKDFDDIVELSKEGGWTLIFNLLAENYEEANSLLGDSILYLMNYNRQILIDRYRRKGIIVVDNAEKVPDKEFIDREWTTEHYAQNGRKIIAQNLARSLKTIYPEKYTEEWFAIKDTSYILDCEKNLYRYQKTTISDEQAHSGQFSSKTGNGLDFSLTYEQSLKNENDTSLSKIMVSAWLYQKNISPEIKLVVEIHADDLPNFWFGKSITRYSEETDQWFDASFTLPIPIDYRKGKLVKVYLYNPTSNIVFLDDLAVTFL